MQYCLFFAWVSTASKDRELAILFSYCNAFSGIGIDDMFVIVQCLNNQKRSHSGNLPPVSEMIGAALKHAGVSITVTSVTDVLGFGVGAVTVRLSMCHQP